MEKIEKPFFEAFPTLKLNKNREILFNETTVEKIVFSKKTNTVKVTVVSNHIIPKRDVYAVEREIEKQVFPDGLAAVAIQERFMLSDRYTLDSLNEEYFDSILEELQHTSRVAAAVLSKAKITHEDNVLYIQAEDTKMCHMQVPFLEDYLTRVYGDRCGFPVSISIECSIPVEKEEQKDEAPVFYSRPGAKQDEDEEKATPAEPSEKPAEEKKSDTTPAEKTAAKIEEKKENKPAKKEEKKAFGDFKKGEGFKKSGDKPEFKRALKSGDNPDLIMGKEFEEPHIKLEEANEAAGLCVTRGQVVEVTTRPIKNERTIVTFTYTDFTDTISSKLFCADDFLNELLAGVKPGAFIKVKGICEYDTYDKDVVVSHVQGIMKTPDFTTKRNDNAKEKRVELHCHTKMSDMDGVSDTKDIVKRAFKWGHKAIAITDHGVCQAFPDANHCVDDFWDAAKKKSKETGEPLPDRNEFFKILYGVEGYLVDDSQTIVTFDNGAPLDREFVVFDIETTGFSPVKDKIIEIGAVKVKNGEVLERFSTFVNPERPIPYRIEQLTTINDNMVKDAPTIETVLPEFLEFCVGATIVAHNAHFDMSFVRENAKRMGLFNEYTYVDTLVLARVLHPDHNKYTLDALAKLFNVPLNTHHRAVDDAECTAFIFMKLLDQAIKKYECTNLTELNAKSIGNAEAVKKAKTYHVIFLAQNDLGRTNLYHMVSESHLTYFNRTPRIPKSVVEKYREGVLVGSACEAGELYSNLVNRQSDEDLDRIVGFYDYLEIQPVGNNRFMIEDEKFPDINSEDDIRDINREIVALGEKFGKPVVATCDVHFLDPEDEVYRRILMAGKGFDDADNQAPLYLHTTDEMLDEFSYLGAAKAKEVVITNTNLIADTIENLSPVRPDKCPPVIPDSDKMLRKICNDRAHEIYGPKLPEIVEARLERELKSIITNGYAVMYIIAQKLVWKSVEDGYLVGSRGSVGSSFVATMSGITEINPLPPHYVCPNCFYVDFEEEDVKAFVGMAGIDMPDKVCPHCGTVCKKDGFDIPFETFLGFKGDKEPDIDLNFSGEYQSKAHKYTEVIFGAGQTFRAGTIAALADKTAYGFVKKYYEERGIKKRPAEINRITQGCVGVRRGTGQHPGGIVVLPVGHDMHSFTPLQHPANDMTTDTITTHFDYHSIDHNLLKLDILGHDDPTMIRMLQDLTGMDPMTIPLDGKDVMSLFQNTEALGITPDDIGGTKLGALGIPEFGTDFAMQMVIEAQPKSFSDLVRIAGLAHGTAVWLGNAQDLILSGTATISTAICTRDDIMTYLIHMGVDPAESFSIMENVRKGKVAKGKCKEWAGWKQDMADHGVPDWYIGSCEKIEYMFPKAHAAAYVMMAWRIAYCKIHKPLAYYSAYFTIRAKAFNYEDMCMGEGKMRAKLAELRKKEADSKKEGSKSEPLSNKEKGEYSDLRIVEEMYARGYEFMPIDLKLVKARSFQIIDGKIMASLISIEGLGESVADQIVIAAQGEPFLSRDDFVARSKASKTIAEKLHELGILGDIPESNQMSLFDFM